MVKGGVSCFTKPSLAQYGIRKQLIKFKSSIQPKPFTLQQISQQIIPSFHFHIISVTYKSKHAVYRHVHVQITYISTYFMYVEEPLYMNNSVCIPALFHCAIIAHCMQFKQTNLWRPVYVVCDSFSLYDSFLWFSPTFCMYTAGKCLCYLFSFVELVLLTLTLDSEVNICK